MVSSGWLAGAATLFSLIYALPLARWLLPAQLRRFPLSLLVGFGLSVGLLTLCMTLVSIVARPFFGLPAFSVIMVAILFLGLWLQRRDLVLPTRVSLRARVREGLEQLRSGAGLVAAALAVVTAGLGLLMVWRTADSPFFGWDTLAIYNLRARSIFMQRGFDLLQIHSPYGPSSYYWAYPPLLPLAYAYAYLASGWENQLLAGVYAGSLALATLGATFALGRWLYSARVGWVAAFVLAVTPGFYRLAISGYTDVPVTFYATLAMLFACRWLTGSSWRDGALAAIFLGLACWTRNTAPLLVVNFALASAGVLVVRLWQRGDWRQAIRWKHVLLMAALVLVFGGWWYVRNLFAHGYLIADPLQADPSLQPIRTLENLFPFSDREWFGYVLSSLYMAGLFYGLWRLIAGPAQGDARPASLRSITPEAILLAFIIPFLLVWWDRASYGLRFLLPLLPALAVLGARAVDGVLWPPLERHWRPRLAVLGMVLLLSLPVAKYISAITILRWVRQGPMATYEQRREWHLGDLYRIYAYVRDHSSDGPVRVLTTHPLQAALEAEFPGVLDTGWPDSMEELRGYDYFIWSPVASAYFNRSPVQAHALLASLDSAADFERVLESNGWIIYRRIGSQASSIRPRNDE